MWSSFFSLLLLLCCWDEAVSLGGGRRIWEQPKPDPPLQDQPPLQDSFPPGFLWGTGTSAFQTEGAWDQEGKGPSVWDVFTQALPTGDGADEASGSYRQWEEDVRALEYLGVQFYSLSLSWPRLFPDGDPRSPPNAAAVQHYGRLLDMLLQKRIRPVVTLFHWDLPQALQQHGGWRNQTLVGLFQQYAAFCFHTFGQRVKLWVTMFNPYLVAAQGYGTGVHAPGERGGAAGALAAGHNLIKAHAEAYHVYHSLFRAHQGGEVSIVLGSHWVEPQRGQASAANVLLCQDSMDAVLGWFAAPIFGDGDYPLSLKTRHGDLMPTFSPEEKLRVKNTADFFSLSFGPNNLRMGRNLVHYGQTVSPDLRRLLSWIQMEYGDLRVLVAEGGWYSEGGVGTEDTVAIYLTKNFISQVLQAVRLDGVQVFGFSAWSLLDGFEWNYGYSVRRGLFYVDFSHPNKTRTPKTSAQFYRQVIAHHGLPREEMTEVKGRFPCDFHWGIADSTLQVHFFPFSPQFTDPRLYRWNQTGDGSFHPVPGVKLQTRPAQCTDYLAIRDHLYLFASTGASHYRFALNWSLILPQGDSSHVNMEALRYYRCVLMELRKQNLEAVVILYYLTRRAPHLGLPPALQASGGWLNVSTVEAFQDYAALVYRELGPWVRFWITINEPNRVVDVFPAGGERHRAAHHLLLAHAKAWRLYERDHQGQGGRVSLALHADWAEPANPFTPSHAAAAERFLLFELGRFLDPLLGGHGDYPPKLRAYLQQKAEAQGLSGSPMPNFTEAERVELGGALSFIALNHFTTRLVSPLTDPQSKTSPDHDCLILSDPTWPSSSLGQAVVPRGLRKMLVWVSQRYGRGPPIIITGSGVDDPAPVEDTLRQSYLRRYLQEALTALHLDGVNLQGFYVWKLQDRHAPEFGLFGSAQHQSRPKASVSLYRDIIRHSGPALEDTAPPCGHRGKRLCPVCSWMSENKAVMFFGGCVLVTGLILTALLIYVIRRRKQNGGRKRRRKGQEGGGRRRGKEGGGRRKEKEGAAMCLCPPVVKEVLTQ